VKCSLKRQTTKTFRILKKITLLQRVIYPLIIF